MQNKKNTHEEMKSIWKNPSNCPSPIFPVIYLETPEAEECRGFIHLENLVGDFDFVGYSLRGEDILIDSVGKMIKLGFKEFVIPQLFIRQLSANELKKQLKPALDCINDPAFCHEILTTMTVEEVVKKIANRFSW